MANLTKEQMMEMDHCMDLLKAEAEGRLIVLPCKVGDTVYRIQFGSGPDKGLTEIGVYEVPFATIYLPEYGKTVFLTHKEAEAALRRGADV